MIVRIVIEAEPQLDGSTRISLDAPDDPLQAMELLNIAVQRLIVKAAEQRAAAASSLVIPSSGVN